jgi:squalene-hopene/tetraprenyl-beta-curcumene cyclase
VSGSDEFWKGLVLYVSRCQNSDTVDPLLAELGIGSSRDGGMRYAPNDTRGPVETLDDGVRIFSSYGSMTYAGLKSLLYARVDRDDPRIQEAFRWISNNFSVRENPGMATKSNPAAGKHGLFYYYHTMAKALSVYGEPVLVDARGVQHEWARELAAHLLSLQRPPGFWQNTSDRWWENIPELDTAYAVVALVECLESLDRPVRPATTAAGRGEAVESDETAGPKG